MSTPETEKEAAKKASDEVLGHARIRAHALIDAGFMVGSITLHLNAGRVVTAHVGFGAPGAEGTEAVR